MREKRGEERGGRAQRGEKEQERGRRGRGFLPEVSPCCLQSQLSGLPAALATARNQPGELWAFCLFKLPGILTRAGSQSGVPSIIWEQTCQFPPVFLPHRPASASRGL